MTRSRKEAGQVLSPHESADILRACEERKRRDARSHQEVNELTMAGPPRCGGIGSERQSVPRSKSKRSREVDASEMDAATPPRRSSRAASLSAQDQSLLAGNGLPSRQRFRSVNALKPAGAAAVARTLLKKGEIDLRTPEALRPACIGAVQASQAQARLFASPAADGRSQGDSRTQSQVRTRQTSYPSIDMTTMDIHSTRAKKVQERQASGAENVASASFAADNTTNLRGLEETGHGVEPSTAQAPEAGINEYTDEPEGRAAEEHPEHPQIRDRAERPLEVSRGPKSIAVLRGADDVGGSLEVPESSGAVPGRPDEQAPAVGAALKVLKRQLLGVNGWRGMQRQGGEGRMGVTEEAQVHQKKLYTLLADTVEKGLNVSALLLGARGGGKSAIVERVIHDLQEAFQERVTVVRLNGLLHSDERTALKEIARQLCEDNDLTVSLKTSTFELNLRFLTDILTECVKAHRAVIFVLDEFDLFTQRPKQTLLYNLLDAIQSSKTQAAVVGISCRLDADELLEKRVRSRFSHRRIQVLEPRASELVRILAGALQLPPSFPHTNFAARFNEAVEAVLADSDVQSLLDIHVSRNQSPRHILDLGFRALCSMDRSRGYLTVEDVKNASEAIEMEPRVESIRGLSVLELYLVIAMKRLEEKERDKYNFNMVFAEYQELRHQNTADLYSRGVSLRAFQHLLGRELIAFVDRRPRGDPVQFRPVKLLVAASEIEAALTKHPTRSSVLEQWFANKAAGKF